MINISTLLKLDDPDVKTLRTASYGWLEGLDPAEVAEVAHWDTVGYWKTGDSVVFRNPNRRVYAAVTRPYLQRHGHAT